MQDHAHYSRRVEAQGAASGGPDRDGGLFARAALLARKGRYAEASELLVQCIDANDCSETEALDLQARIYAQQGMYVHAESCWRKAQSLNSSNPAYAEALSRLRRARRPMGSLYQLSTLFGALAVLLLLLWQIVLVNPKVDHRQDAATQSLTTIRGDVADLNDASERRDLELAMTLSKVQEGLRHLDTQLVERLAAMPTAEGTTQNRNAIIEYLDEKVAALEKATAQRAENVDARQSAADVTQVKRFELIETAVSRIGQTTSGIESGLRDLDTRVSDRLGSMSTMSEMTENRDAIIGHLDDKVAVLEKMMAQTAEKSDEQQSAADAAQKKQLELIETTVSRLGQTMSRIESTLAKQIHAMESTVAKRVEAVGSGIKRDMKLLAMSTEVSVLQRSVSELEKQLGLLMAAIQELKQSSSRDEAGSGSPRTQPATQPASQKVAPSED